MSNFKIENRKAYVWRVNNTFHHCTHGSIPSWYIVDADTGTVLAGGHDDGANWRSGTADFPRKRDAQCWLSGYLAGIDGRDYAVGKHGPLVDRWVAREWADKNWPKLSAFNRDDAASRYADGVYHGAKVRLEGAGS